jgi:hypothetical protein
VAGNSELNQPVVLEETEAQAARQQPTPLTSDLEQVILIDTCGLIVRIRRLLEGYALSTSGHVKIAEFGDHLGGCAECRDEVARSRRAGRFGVSETATPPASLRVRILLQAEHDILGSAEAESSAETVRD